MDQNPDTEYEVFVEEYDERIRWMTEENLIPKEITVANNLTYYLSKGDKECTETHNCDECGEIILGTDDCWVITMDSGKEFYHCLQCQPKEGVL